MIPYESTAAPGGVAGPGGVSSFGSYPGGKSGAGIYQRLINLIPRHRILVTAFAGRCGVTRRIKPAEHTIVIDADPDVCQWWDDWRRSLKGRALEIHCCDSIEWLRFRFGLTEYTATGSGDAGDAADSGDAAVSRRNASSAGAASPRGGGSDVETFVFCDPPYVLSERSGGKQYACELTDSDHERLVGTVTAIPASPAAVMLCGYRSPIYESVDRKWRSIDHRVPTRRGLQDERIWMNYENPDLLHDHRYIGMCRRTRERIRRRQRNWRSQLDAMGTQERAAMLEALTQPTNTNSPL